jgi:hypothetical protein
MMEQRLQLYKAKNNILPERVLVYRDGVSEVKSHETCFYLPLDSNNS